MSVRTGRDVGQGDDLGVQPAVADGSLELPLPPGAPGSLWRSAGLLTSVASRAGAGPLATQGGQAFFLARTWAGAAFDAARQDAARTAERITGQGERLGEAAAALAGFGDALDVAQRRVLVLQRAWDAAHRAAVMTLTDLPFTATPDGGSVGHAAEAGRRAACAELTRHYAACLADLDTAADRATQALLSLSVRATQRVVPDGAGGSAAAGTPSESARSAALAGLDVVTGRLATLRAEADVLELQGLLDSVARGQVEAADGAAALLSGRGADPIFAQAVMASMSPAQLGAVVAACAVRGAESWAVDPSWLAARSAALVSGLGVAMTTAADPRRTTALDPATAGRIDRWRAGWLPRLSASVGQSVRRPDGSTVGGGWVQGQLLAGAAREGPGHSPGPLYAASVGTAMVSLERAVVRRAGSGEGMHFTGTTGGRVSVFGPGLEDGILALEHTLRTDPESSRAFLLGPVPAERDVLVVDHLVGDRFRLLSDEQAAASLAALGELVVEAGSDPRDGQSTHLAARFVNDVGATAASAQDLPRFRRALGPALYPLATVIGSHPDALCDLLDGTTQQGVDAQQLDSVERLVREGREPGTSDIVWADRRTAAAALGELALDRVDGSSASDGPTRAPALVHAVESLAERQQPDLLSAVARDGAGDPHALDAAARRVGSTVGFIVASGGETLAGVRATQDEAHTAMTAIADLVVDDVPLPHQLGTVGAALARHAAAGVVAELLPTDAESAQRAATAATLGRIGDGAIAAGRTVVSEAAPWSAAQSPQTWAAATTRHVTPFWGADGAPRPETELQTAELRSFNDWRRDLALSVYDEVPARIRAGIQAGAAQAVTQVPRHSS